MKKNKHIYRNIYLGRDEAARELQGDLNDLSRAVDISIARRTRQFFRDLVDEYRSEIDNYREMKKRTRSIFPKRKGK